MAFTVANAITYARQKAQADSNGISDTNGLAWANNGLIDLTRDYILHGIDASQTQEAYATLAASDAQPGRFLWPADMFALKTIEADFTGVGGQNYVQAQKLDVSNLQGNTSWDYLRVNQSTFFPVFTNHGDTGEIFPTPVGSASVLVRIYYYIAPTEYAATTSNITYPYSLDYRMVGDKILIGYYESLREWESVKMWQERYEKKRDDAIKILGVQSKQPIEAEKLHMTGWEF